MINACMYLDLQIGPEVQDGLEHWYICYQPLLHSEWQLYQQPWHSPTMDENHIAEA